jgi:excisionase family DNA binding protein
LSSAFFISSAIHGIIHKPKMNREYLSKKDLATYLGISKGTIERLMKQGLPHIKLERRVLFKQSDIDHWLETKRVNKRPD